MKKIREMFFCISYLLKQIKIINRIKIYPTGFLSPKDYINKKELDCGNEKIPVFLSADENYAPFVATTMYSILKNTKSFVEFYILDGGISLKNQEKIKTLGKHFKNFSIEFIKIDTAKLFAGFPTRLHFSIDMYTRYLIPELKPQLKKVIYSDVDVIFNGDIKEAFQEDLSGYALGAVPYLYGYLNPDKNEIKSYHKRLGLSVSHKYFESGFLIIDTEVWRKMKITKKLLLKVKENKNIILTPDQDLLNIFFENNYKKLDSKYIVVPHRENIMLLNEATRKSIHDPFVIHFAGSSKPWKYPKMKQGEYFWDCASGTKFYDTLVYDSISIFSFNKAMEFPNKILKKIYNKIIFAILNPKKLIKKYMNIILHGRLRQPIRVVYYALRLKKLK